MNIAVLFPVALAIAIFFFVMWLKTKMPLSKFRKTMLLVTFICALLSLFSVLMSYYYSTETVQLTRLTLPVLLLVLTGLIYMKTKQQDKE